MSYEDSASIAAQLRFFKSTFQAWCATNGGGAFICSDLVHLWKLLFNNSQTAKVLIMYVGEQVRGDFGIAAPLARVDRRYVVVVSRGRSLKLDRGDVLAEDNFNAPPLFDVVEEVRDIIRAMITDPNWTERPIDYSGVVPFSTEGSGLIVDAYSIEFSVGTQLQLISDTPTSPANI